MDPEKNVCKYTLIDLEASHSVVRCWWSSIEIDVKNVYKYSHYCRELNLMPYYIWVDVKNSNFINFIDLYISVTLNGTNLNLLSYMQQCALSEGRKKINLVEMKCVQIIN